MKHSYKPIDCSYHDLLLDRATRKKSCRIIYKNDDNMVETVESVIVDVYTKSGEEFMLLENKHLIRLDKLISVDGQQLAG
ncbi:MAG: hypothetical protein ACFCUU_15985 [Cyclobacteriaceae bacterium]